ncbi:MAG TPA: zinc-ribbon domain-containing protein [Polyangiaceae bacterium]|nr:zinc-ribbon domain-containing protein [Polyangiaceae bacterium]
MTCTGCPAKYAVPDEKVRGKKVRITCKHCGTNIVVDGSAIGAEQSVAPKVAEPAQPQPAASEASYIVGFADDRQETHTVSAIVAMYLSSKLDEDSLVWKDGMPDWLSPFDVPEIAGVFRKSGVARRLANVPLSTPPDDEPTMVARSPFGDDVDLAPGPRLELELDMPRDQVKPTAAIRQSVPELQAGATPFAAAPKAPAVAAKPAAAASRRTEKRGGAVDLFGGVADAGGEADASLDLGFPQEAEHKLTGARNESSVLFSLDALTKPDAKAAGQKKARDKEQEKQATAALFGDNAPDSLSNMGGGGFSALAAPDFTKPVAAMPEAQVRPSDPVEVPNPPEKKKGAAVWVVAVLGVAAAAGVAFFMMQKKASIEKAPESTAPDTKAAAAQPSAAPAPAPTEAPAASVAEVATTSAAESVAQAITAAGAKPAASAAAVAATPATAGTVNKPAEKPADTKKPDAPAATNAPAPAADGAAFDKSAAVAALGAAAANAASCKKPDGPTGSGKVSVTFAPSGRATMTNVGGAFAGTDVGGCVARLFRAAKVPAFSGDPVTVSKSFSIE